MLSYGKIMRTAPHTYDLGRELQDVQAGKPHLSMEMNMSQSPAGV